MTGAWIEPGGEPAPSRVELRRAAAATRRVIEHLVTTTASVEVMAQLAADLESVADRLEAEPGGRGFESWAESANAGDPHAFFDHSPQIGKANPIAPPLDLAVSEGRVRGRAVFGSAYEGPPGCVHGGHIAAAFDEVLGMTQSLGGQPGMTGTLTVIYRKPTPLHTELRFEGVLERTEGRKTFTRAELYSGEVLCAEAQGIFISFDLARMRQLADHRRPAAEEAPSP